MVIMIRFDQRVLHDVIFTPTTTISIGDEEDMKDVVVTVLFELFQTSTFV